MCPLLFLIPNQIEPSGEVAGGPPFKPRDKPSVHCYPPLDGWGLQNQLCPWGRSIPQPQTAPLSPKMPLAKKLQNKCPLLKSILPKREDSNRMYLYYPKRKTFTRLSWLQRFLGRPKCAHEYSLEPNVGSGAEPQRERQWRAEEGVTGAMLVFIGRAKRSSWKDWVEAMFSGLCFQCAWAQDLLSAQMFVSAFW